jgi:hypothetical protein
MNTDCTLPIFPILVDMFPNLTAFVLYLHGPVYRKVLTVRVPGVRSWLVLRGFVKTGDRTRSAARTGPHQNQDYSPVRSWTGLHRSGTIPSSRCGDPCVKGKGVGQGEING